MKGKNIVIVVIKKQDHNKFLGCHPKSPN